MRNLMSGGLVAAALGTALLAAGAFPASAQVARPQSALATGGENSDLLTMVASRGGGGGGGGGGVRGGGGGGGMRAGDFRSSGRDLRDRSSHSFAMARADQGRFSRSNSGFDRNDMRRRFVNRDRDHDGHHHHNRCFNGRCVPVFAFGGFGYGAYASDYYDDSYIYADNNAVAYCMSRFRTYNPNTGTYTGNDGLQHPCP